MATLREVLYVLVFSVCFTSVLGVTCSDNKDCQSCSIASDSTTTCYWCETSSSCTDTVTSIVCPSGWLQYCPCSNYTECGTCMTNTGCGWCDEGIYSKCTLGVWEPADQSQCANKNFKYGKDACANQQKAFGNIKVISVVVVSILVVCLVFVVIPVIIHECRKRRALNITS